MPSAFLPNQEMFWEEHTHKPLQNFLFIRDVQTLSGLFPFGFKMAEEVEDWGTNNQVRKSGNNLFISSQEFTKVTKLSNISDASTNFLVTRALWWYARCERHTCKHAWMLRTFVVIWYSFLPASSRPPDILLYWIPCIIWRIVSMWFYIYCTSIFVT